MTILSEDVRAAITAGRLATLATLNAEAGAPRSRWYGSASTETTS